MLDTGFHQGAGLHSFTPQSELRVLAVASQEHPDNGLETLWQLCASLQRLGYPVVVLDATAQETEEAPGLSHLLREVPGHDGMGMNAGSATSSLAVIPAARGLWQINRQAQAEGTPPLHSLLPYFRTYSMVVLHAPAPLLGPLLTHTSTMPLVVMEGSGAAGVLATYKRLKQIALHAGLPCSVVAVLQGQGKAERRRTQGALHTLQACADRHLGGQLQTTTISANNPQDVQRLALQLLENAGTIQGVLPVMSSSAHSTGMPAHIVRSH